MSYCKRERHRDTASEKESRKREERMSEKWESDLYGCGLWKCWNAAFAVNIYPTERAWWEERSQGCYIKAEVLHQRFAGSKYWCLFGFVGLFKPFSLVSSPFSTGNAAQFPSLPLCSYLRPQASYFTTLYIPGMHERLQTPVKGGCSSMCFLVFHHTSQIGYWFFLHQN